MSEPTKELIQRTFLRLIEDWALMLVDGSMEISSLEQYFEAGKTLHVASLTFKGPFCGTFSVACQDGFASNLVHNMLGSDDEVSSPEIQDSVKELVNVLAGNLITTVYGPDTIFALEAPVIKECAVIEADQLFSHTGFGCFADGEPIALTFSFTHG